MSITRLMANTTKNITTLICWLVYGLLIFLVEVVTNNFNENNSSTQQIATLLGAKCCVGLATLLQRVATCCELKSNQCACPGATLFHEPGQTTTKSCNIRKSCLKNMTIFKFEPTTPNMLQHVATWWPNASNMLHPTTLRYVALRCCGFMLCGKYLLII